MNTVTSHVLPRPAVVAALGSGAEPRRLPAHLIEAEGRWMTLLMQTAIRPGTAVRVDVQGGLVLGTAAWAEGGVKGFRVGVEIDQIIPDTAELARLITAVMGRRPPASGIHVPVPAPPSTVD